MIPQEVAVRLERQAMLPTCGTGAPGRDQRRPPAAGVTELGPGGRHAYGIDGKRVVRRKGVLLYMYMRSADFAVRRIEIPAPVLADSAVQGEDGALQLAPWYSRSGSPGCCPAFFHVRIACLGIGGCRRHCWSQR